MCKLLDKYGEDELNRIRDLAKENADALQLTKEAKILDSLIGAILATRPVHKLDSPIALSYAQKEPFDVNRIALFKAFGEYLSRCDFTPTGYDYSASAWRHLAFYESYFSNYIEGTEFAIDEAEKIIFEKRILGERHEYSHDVLSVYDVVSDYTEMSTLPTTPKS